MHNDYLFVVNFSVIEFWFSLWNKQRHADELFDSLPRTHSNTHTHTLTQLVSVAINSLYLNVRTLVSSIDIIFCLHSEDESFWNYRELNNYKRIVSFRDKTSANLGEEGSEGWVHTETACIHLFRQCPVVRALINCPHNLGPFINYSVLDLVVQI